MWKKIRPGIRGIYYTLTNQGIPVHRQEESQPFFIVGSGRCGTTLLRRILQASPEVHIPPENWGLGYVIYHFRKNKSYLRWDQLVEIVIAAHQHRTAGWFETVNDPEDLFENVLSLSKSERSLYRLIDHLYRYHGSSVGAEFRRWGDKTPVNVNHMEAILKSFPDARFINLVRDGVDVVHSWSQHEKYNGNVVRPAIRWKEAVVEAHAFAEQYPEKSLEVRYERLVQEPEKTVARICQFVDLAYESEMLSRTDHYEEMGRAQEVSYFQNVFGSITSENIGKGRRSLGTGQKEKISPLIDDVLSRFGYEPIWS